MTPEEVAAWVAESRAAQGLPPTIRDPEAIAKAAAMVADTLTRSPESQRKPDAASAEPPDGNGGPRVGRRHSKPSISSTRTDG